jgi:hypothetical protein
VVPAGHPQGHRLGTGGGVLCWPPYQVVLTREQVEKDKEGARESIELNRDGRSSVTSDEWRNLTWNDE